MSVEHEDRLVRLVEFLETHRFGKYPGLVEAVRAADGCIRATVPDVYGKEQLSPWAKPALPFAGSQHGLALLPEVKDGVWIEFQAGDPALPIWSGCFWASGQRPSPATEKARVLATSNGHRLVLDEDANIVQLKHAGGAEITMSDDEITLKLGVCELKITKSEIDLNDGMVKVTKTGASLVKDSMKFGT